jgi:hypothetical protein
LSSGDIYLSIVDRSTLVSLFWCVFDGAGGWLTLSAIYSKPHEGVGAPSFAQSALLLLALGAKGGLRITLMPKGLRRFHSGATNTSFHAVVIIASRFSPQRGGVICF